MVAHVEIDEDGQGSRLDTGESTLKTEINETIRNLDINDSHNTEMHRDVWIIVVISLTYQFRIVSVCEGFRLHSDLVSPTQTCGRSQMLRQSETALRPRTTW
jgi:hypothetical protein